MAYGLLRRAPRSGSQSESAPCNQPHGVESCYSHVIVALAASNAKPLQPVGLNIVYAQACVPGGAVCTRAGHLSARNARMSLAQRASMRSVRRKTAVWSVVSSSSKSGVFPTDD